MADIKWAGIVRDAAGYQRGELPTDARKLDMPDTVNEMMLKAVPFMVPSLVVIFISMFLKTFLSGERVVSFPFIAVGAAIGLVLVIVHELLHAIVYPKGATVYIGIMPKQLAAVALASFPLTRRRFVVMSLMPYILGILPLVLFWLMPAEYKVLNGILFGISIMGLITPYPDSFNVYQVLRQVPGGARVQFHGNDLYCIS